MAKAVRHLRGVHQKQFVKLFDAASQRNNRWTVFSDFVHISAIAISNTVDHDHAEEREKEYARITKSYNQKEMDCLRHMFAEVVEGLEENPDQDFMGDLFMNLELGNEFRGQFFTPYHVSKMMSLMLTSKEGLEREITEKGFIVMSDPCCGAGGMLVAFANACKEREVNFQTNALFVAQDIDYTAACMCYIQMSLLGCPGYVVIANTLSNPATAIDKRMLIPTPTQNVWYTPLYFLPEWHYRRQFAYLDLALNAAVAAAPESHTGETPTTAPEPEPKPIQSSLNETKNGQLTFF